MDLLTAFEVKNFVWLVQDRDESGVRIFISEHRHADMAKEARPDLTHEELFWLGALKSS